MKIKNLLYQVAPPCAKCPYTLGLIHTTVSPCPQCRLGGYRAYERFKRLTVAIANTQNPTGASPESSFYRIVITPELNSVIMLSKKDEVLRVIPMDGSMFKDMGEAFPLLGEHPHVETINCKAIVEETLDHFADWYATIRLNGDFCNADDLTDLMRGMMVYLIKHHPMAMASSVSGPEIVNKINYELMDRIEKAHNDRDEDE